MIFKIEMKKMKFLLLFKPIKLPLYYLTKDKDLKYNGELGN